MQYINCKAYAQEILDEVKASKPKKKLWIISMGDDPASKAYIKGKLKDCEYCGIRVEHLQPKDQEAMILQICSGNRIPLVGGIIVQLPLPDDIDENECVDRIVPEKDVDGFHPKSRFKPCTPEGIVFLLQKELGALEGKSALIIGKGKLVGLPLSQMLLQEGCTVTIAHSRTRNLDALLSSGYDIIVSAVGKAKLIDLQKCKADIVVDVGINRDENGKMCGDCFNFAPDDGSNMKVTSVPGGVGLLTRAILMHHMMKGENNGKV